MKVKSFMFKVYDINEINNKKLKRFSLNENILWFYSCFHLKIKE